jgi:hypothetical protein
MSDDPILAALARLEAGQADLLARIGRVEAGLAELRATVMERFDWLDRTLTALRDDMRELRDE